MIASDPVTLQVVAPWTRLSRAGKGPSLFSLRDPMLGVRYTVFTPLDRRGPVERIWSYAESTISVERVPNDCTNVSVTISVALPSIRLWTTIQGQESSCMYYRADSTA